MRFVVFISESQQTLQEEYRVRARIIRERTALRNEIRGLLSEFGLLLPVGIRHVRKIQQGILPRGPTTACALVACIGNAHDFKKGRQLAAWLG